MQQNTEIMIRLGPDEYSNGNIQDIRNIQKL